MPNILDQATRIIREGTAPDAPPNELRADVAPDAAVVTMSKDLRPGVTLSAYLGLAWQGAKRVGYGATLRWRF